MDLENCHEEEQETRQKKPFQGGNNGLLPETRESGPLEEKGRYAPTVQAVGLNAQRHNGGLCLFSPRKSAHC